MNKNFKYELCPQWKTYERIGYKWLPFIMFNQIPNFRSEILNTDDKGFRFNSKNFINKKSIFDHYPKQEVSILCGGSFAFGAGANLDENTISGYLSKSGVNCLNLSGSAHIGFQELISIFSNFNHLKNVKEIIFLSGINDLYLSTFFDINYPDNFYLYSEFNNSLNIKSSNYKKKILKFLFNIFNPKILKNKNIDNLRKEDFIEFLTSKDFRKTFESKSPLKITFEEKLKRNFKIYRMLGNFFDCKVYFYLQPALNWSKEKSSEEQQLFDYSNLFFKEKLQYYNKLFSIENYEFLKNLCIKFSNENNVYFNDLNELFKKNLKKDDWIFLDSVHVNDKGNKLVSEIIKTR